MEITRLMSIPMPSTSAFNEPFILTGEDLYVFFSAPVDSQPEPHVEYLCIRFTNPIAHRSIAEIHCKLWHLDAYDTICKIEDSDWLRELKDATPKDFKDCPATNHYAIYLDSVGFIEVLADEVSMFPAAPEELDKIYKLSTFILMDSQINLFKKWTTRRAAERLKPINIK